MSGRWNRAIASSRRTSGEARPKSVRTRDGSSSPLASPCWRLCCCSARAIRRSSRASRGVLRSFSIRFVSV